MELLTALGFVSCHPTLNLFSWNLKRGWTILFEGNAPHLLPVHQNNSSVEEHVTALLCFSALLGHVFGGQIKMGADSSSFDQLHPLFKLPEQHPHHSGMFLEGISTHSVSRK